MCKDNGWDDNNLPENIAFISISSTPDCIKHVIEDEDAHYFKQNHPNVLNLDFDDITENEEVVETESGSIVCKCISDKDASRAVEFISRNIGKDFFIHCRAGKSRSQGFIVYIMNLYGGVIDFMLRMSNPPISHNSLVLKKLTDAAARVGEDIRYDFLREGYHIEKFHVSSDFCITIVLQEFPEYTISAKNHVWSLKGPGREETGIDEFGLIDTIGKILGGILEATKSL